MRNDSFFNRILYYFLFIQENCYNLSPDYVSTCFVRHYWVLEHFLHGGRPVEVFLRQDFQYTASLCGIMGNQSKSAKTPQRELWIFTSIAHVRIQLDANFICSIRRKYKHRENIKDQRKAEDLGTWLKLIRVLLSCVV